MNYLSLDRKKKRPTPVIPTKRENCANIQENQITKIHPKNISEKLYYIIYNTWIFGKNYFNKFCARIEKKFALRKEILKPNEATKDKL